MNTKIIWLDRVMTVRVSVEAGPIEGGVVRIIAWEAYEGGSPLRLLTERLCWVTIDEHTRLKFSEWD